MSLPVVLALLASAAPAAAPRTLTLPTPWPPGTAWSIEITRERQARPGDGPLPAWTASVDVSIAQATADGFVASWARVSGGLPGSGESVGPAEARVLKLRLDRKGRVRVLINREQVLREIESAGAAARSGLDASSGARSRDLSQQRAAMIVTRMLEEATLYFSWCGEALTAGLTDERSPLGATPTFAGLPATWATLVETDAAPGLVTITREGKADPHAVARQARLFQVGGPPRAMPARRDPGYGKVPEEWSMPSSSPRDPGTSSGLGTSMPRGPVGPSLGTRGFKEFPDRGDGTRAPAPAMLAVEQRETFIMNPATGLPESIVHETLRGAAEPRTTTRIRMKTSPRTAG